MAKLRCILALALVLLPACASEPSVGASAELESGRVALLLYGFFASGESAPGRRQRIDYADVDLDQAYERLSRKIGRYGYRSPLRVLSQAETSELTKGSTVSRAEASARVGAALDVLDALANERPEGSEPVRALHAPVELPGWGPSDRILLVVGLETALQNESAGGVRSLVGCFWFDGAGDSLQFVPAPYDFRGLDTQELVRLVGERCRLPQPQPPART